MCVVCALCACVFLHSLTSAHLHLAGIALPTPVPCHTGSRRPTAPCVPCCTISAFGAVPHCLLLCTSLHCTVCALLHCSCGHRVVGIGHCFSASAHWAAQPVQRTTSLPRGSGHRNSCKTLPHCLGAVGTGTHAMHRHSVRRQWAVQHVRYTASLPGGSGQCNSCNALLHSMGVVGTGTPAIHCLTAWGQWAMGLMQ